MKSQYLNFFVLALILVGGVGMIFYNRGDSTLQAAAGIITGVAYALWGIIHHATQGDLHLKVVIEYILIGCIATILLLTMFR